MNISKVLNFIKQIELPNNETFSIVGYNDEKYLYIREDYWQMTVKDLKIDFNGKIIDERFYDPEKGDSYALEIDKVPFFTKYSFTKVNQEEPIDITELVHRHKSIFKAGQSHEKEQTFYYPAENEKKWLLNYFKRHKKECLKWLNPDAFIGIFSDKLISKIQLKDSLFLSCRLIHCAVQMLDKQIKLSEKEKERIKNFILKPTYNAALLKTFDLGKHALKNWNAEALDGLTTIIKSKQVKWITGFKEDEAKKISMKIYNIKKYLIEEYKKDIETTNISDNIEIYPYFWVSFLEIGKLTLNPLKYELIYRFPEGTGEKEFNSPGKIIQINNKILIKDNGQYRARDRIHILEIQK